MLQLTYIWVATLAFSTLAFGVVLRRAEGFSFAVSALAWFTVAFNSYNVEVVDGGSPVSVQQPAMFWFSLGLGLMALGLLIPAVMEWLPEPQFGKIEDTLGDRL